MPTPVYEPVPAATHLSAITPVPLHVAVPSPAIAASTALSGRRTSTDVDRLSSAVRELAIEACQPPPFTQVVKDVPEVAVEAQAPIRRGRSATKGKGKEIVLTPVIAPVPGDTPQVPIVPLPRRKRKH